MAYRFSPVLFVGDLVLMALLVGLATGAPALLPVGFLLWILLAAPHRIWSFAVAKRYTFFLVDFCYVSCLFRPARGGHLLADGQSTAALTQLASCAPQFAALSCAAFLVFTPTDLRLEAALYVLCEGPLAGGTPAAARSCGKPGSSAARSCAAGPPSQHMTPPSNIPSDPQEL
jgi:hypothetical protein